jgi:hypothetical protein
LLCDTIMFLPSPVLSLCGARPPVLPLFFYGLEL